MRRWIRLLVGVACIAGLIALAGAVAPAFFGLRKGPAASGKLSLAGLKAEVRLIRDESGVPHIWAQGDADAYFGLGFAHAQDRLWQMDVLRRAATGRLSEFFGERTLSEDRLTRTLGFGQAAAGEFSRLSPSARTRLEAYTAGVNAWMTEVRAGRADRPFEWEWLGVKGEEWTPIDTLAIVRLRAWLLSRSLGAIRLLDRLVRDSGGVTAQDFFPEREVDDGNELVGQLLRWGAKADRLAGNLGLNGALGSSGFVVSGSRTESGKPILANDPHLELRMPAFFYMAHLRTDSGEIGGATWPGMPIFWTGNNREIAWGQVVAHASVSDLYRESLHPSKEGLYDRGGRWLKLEESEEIVSVRGRESESLRIGRTRHGPLLNHAFPDDPFAAALSLRWTGQAKQSGFENLLALQHSTDWEGFRRALETFPVPVTTFLYADQQGQIGSRVAGHLPDRKIETGLVPTRGENPMYDWRGHIPFNDLPETFGTEAPYVVASTQPHSENLRLRVAWLWSRDAASKRVTERLKRTRRLGFQDALAIQRETMSDEGPRLIRAWLGKIKPSTGPESEVHQMLMNWDGGTSVDSQGASVYHVFRQRLAAEFMRIRMTEDEVESLQALTEVLDEPAPGALVAGFLDRTDVSKHPEILRRALGETWASMTARVSSNPRKWSWGRVHRASLPHDFEALGPFSARAVTWRLSRGPFAVPGDPASAWTSYHDSIPTENASVGPVLRYAVDLGDFDHPFYDLAGGQSGHAASPHYDDGLNDWLRGKPRPLWMHWGDITYHETGVWELHPSSK